MSLVELPWCWCKQLLKAVAVFSFLVDIDAYQLGTKTRVKPQEGIPLVYTQLHGRIRAYSSGGGGVSGEALRDSTARELSSARGRFAEGRLGR